MITLQRHDRTNKAMRFGGCVLFASRHTLSSGCEEGKSGQRHGLQPNCITACVNSRGLHSATHTVATATRAGQIESSTLCRLPHSLGQSRAKSRSAPKWVWLGIRLSTTSSKLCKKGKLCLFAVQSDESSPLPTAKRFYLHQPHLLQPYSPPRLIHLAAIAFSRVFARKSFAMSQLTSSFASAAAGQNRESRGSGRSDATRGAGSGEW